MTWQAEASGLSQSHEPDRLSVLSLWISLQTVGMFGFFEIGRFPKDTDNIIVKSDIFSLNFWWIISSAKMIAHGWSK